MGTILQDIKKKLHAFVAAIVLAAAAAQGASAQQNYSISTHSLSWDAGQTGLNSIYLHNPDSLSVVMDISGCQHFIVDFRQGWSSIDVRPAYVNESYSDIVQHLYITIDDWGTAVTETVTLTHLGVPIPSGGGTDPEPDPDPEPVSPWLDGLSVGNYIQKTTFTNADGSSFFRDVTYYDGLGYGIQSLQVAGSPSGKTVASQTVYDTMHRPDSVAYLPYVRGDGGAGELDAAHTLDDIGYWYHSACGDSRPYAVKTYESSQYGRLLSIQREGDEWNADGGHRTTFVYGFNAASDDVLRLSWKPGANAGDAPTVRCAGTWPEGSLSRTRLTDENGAVSDTYTDARGRTVCTRTWNGAASTAGGPGTGAMSETLYAYDYRDSLVLVVQPEGAAALKALPAESRLMTIEDNAANANNTIYKEYCFGYIYDGWGNLIREHVPGGGTVERTYDARDRLVLETNDLMAPRAIQTVYDNFDRVVQRRIVDANLSQVCPLYSAEYHPFGSVSGALTGFIADADVAEAAEVETANIKGMLKSETLYPAANADGTAPAGGITRTRNYWYDYRGRIVQIQESDSDGWAARYSTKYDFVGNVVATKETHTNPQNETHWLLTENTYDARGRLTECLRRLDGDYLRPVYYNYDELGRLSRKDVGDGPDNIGYIAFDYDIHGWTTGIEARNNWGQDTVFRETLRYASPQKPGSTARFDGNISEITYTSYNGTSTPPTDTYGYAYDGMNRLTDAAHYAGAAATQSLLKTEKNITYDRNGNITGLNRYGAAGLSEMLSFTHAGNRLSSVQSWDGANLPQIGTFTYDAMGNQLMDSRKGLQFCYNFANLPSKVEGMAGNGNAGLTLSYGYLSDGTKTSAITETAAGSGAEGLKYRGSFVYETVQVPGSEVSEEFLSGIGWSEGRIAFDNPFEVAADSAAVEAVSLPDGLTARLLAHGGVEEPGDTTETAASLLGTMHDLWYIADHLGNTRAVVNMTFGGFVAESNEYLPFGTRFDGTLALPENRYRLAGKEEQRFGRLDLALSDFGARYYDPFTCRWTTRDPMAGKYHSLSPYNYCNNDPINKFDPNGNAANFVVGAAVGFASEFVIQVATNIAKGDNFYQAVNNIDGKSVLISTLAGASGVGIVSKVKQAGKALSLGKTAMAVIETGTEAIVSGTESAAKQLASDGSVSIKETAVDAAVGAVASGIGQKAKASKQGGPQASILRRQVDRAERVARGSSNSSPKKMKANQLKQQLESYGDTSAQAVNSLTDFTISIGFETYEDKRNH